MSSVSGFSDTQGGKTPRYRYKPKTNSCCQYTVETNTPTSIGTPTSSTSSTSSCMCDVPMKQEVTWKDCACEMQSVSDNDCNLVYEQIPIDTYNNLYPTQFLGGSQTEPETVDEVSVAHVGSLTGTFIRAYQNTYSRDKGTNRQIFLGSRDFYPGTHFSSSDIIFPELVQDQKLIRQNTYPIALHPNDLSQSGLDAITIGSTIGSGITGDSFASVVVDVPNNMSFSVGPSIGNTMLSALYSMEQDYSKTKPNQNFITQAPLTNFEDSTRTMLVDALNLSSSNAPPSNLSTTFTMNSISQMHLWIVTGKDGGTPVINKCTKELSNIQRQTFISPYQWVSRHGVVSNAMTSIDFKATTDGRINMTYREGPTSPLRSVISPTVRFGGEPSEIYDILATSTIGGGPIDDLSQLEPLKHAFSAACCIPIREEDLCKAIGLRPSKTGLGQNYLSLSAVVPWYTDISPYVSTLDTDGCDHTSNPDDPHFHYVIRLDKTPPYPLITQYGPVNEDGGSSYYLWIDVQGLKVNTCSDTVYDVSRSIQSVFIDGTADDLLNAQVKGVITRIVETMTGITPSLEPTTIKVPFMTNGAKGGMIIPIYPYLRNPPFMTLSRFNVANNGMLSQLNLGITPEINMSVINGKVTLTVVGNE